VNGERIRLVGIDVDGTLVGSGGRVADRVWAAAGRARQTGIHLVLCSGRPAFGSALEYARRLDAAGWHVFQNGSSIVNLTTGESRSEAIPEAAVRTLIIQARRSGNVLELYSDTEYVSESTDVLARDHAELLGLPYQVRPLESLTGPIVRAQWLLTGEQTRRMIAVVPPGLEVAQSTSPLMPGTQFVGLTHAGVSKGSAIRAVAAQYGLGLEDVMYVGDAGNDLPALAIVGHPVAMGNAAPAVLDATAHHVGHVDQGGLADALEQAMASWSR
jgi:Cof subfamily protein (haloacid dehalogenase superfamily)